MLEFGLILVMVLVLVVMLVVVGLAVVMPVVVVVCCDYVVVVVGFTVTRFTQLDAVVVCFLLSSYVLAPQTRLYCLLRAWYLVPVSSSALQQRLIFSSQCSNLSASSWSTPYL